jgi:integrase/recombinase XerD
MLRLPLHNKEYIRMLDEFGDLIVAQGYSGGRNNLPLRTREFLFFLETRKINNIKDVKTSDIIDFYEYLCKRPNMNYEGTLSNNAVRTHMRGVSYFFEFLVNSKVIEATPCGIPRMPVIPARDRMPLSEQEVQQLYAAASNMMERAMLACAYGLGMRRMEMSLLNVNDVLFSHKEVAIRESKFYKSRSVPMAEGVIKDLKQYLMYSRPEREMYGRPCDAFFLNRNGERLLKTSYNKRFKELVLRTGNKELIARRPTIHLLRHSISVHMIDRGASADYVRSFLGHTYLETTLNVYSKKRKQRTKLYQLFKSHLEDNNIKAI